MEREELFKKVAEIISEKLNVPIEDIEEDSHLIEDLGADSLDAFDLVMVFEDEFGIKLEDWRTWAWNEKKCLKGLRKFFDG